MMEHITLYLEKFAKLALNNGKVKQVVVEAVKKMTGWDIEASAVEVRDSQIRIRAEAVLRSELFIRHEELGRLVAQAVPGLMIKKV
jgi:hypothetical protein